MEEKTFPFELKSIDEEGTFEGYAAIFDKPDKMGEVIAKGAFTKTLKEGKTRPMCWYHDPTNPLGTVDLETDEKGLKVKGAFDLNVQAAREKHSLMKKKAIRGLSFGYKTVKDLWDGTTRILKELSLFEISPCTFQMHPDALVTNVKSFEMTLKSLGEVIIDLEGFKGKLSTEKMTLINNAVKALTAILKKSEPSKDTQADKKSRITPIIEALEAENKPQPHLFGSIIEVLENSK